MSVYTRVCVCIYAYSSVSLYIYIYIYMHLQKNTELKPVKCRLKIDLVSHHVRAVGSKSRHFTKYD